MPRLSPSVPPGAPSQVVASGLRAGPERSPQAFNGCIHNVRINGEAQDLTHQTAGAGGKVRLVNSSLLLTPQAQVPLLLSLSQLLITAFLPMVFHPQSDGVLAGCHSCSICAQGTCKEGGETGVTCDCPPGHDRAFCAQTTGPNPCLDNR